LRITERCQLPPETALRAYQLQKETESAARWFRENTSQPVEDRRAALQSLRSEMSKALSGTLGPAAFDAYQKYQADGQASWFELEDGRSAP